MLQQPDENEALMAELQQAIDRISSTWTPEFDKQMERDARYQRQSMARWEKLFAQVTKE